MSKKFGGLEKSRTFALPFEKRVADEAESSLKDWRRNLPEKIFFEKSFEKVWKFENNAYLCSPVRKTGSRKRI